MGSRRYCYDIPLKDGKTLWCFGDTFLGPVNADRSLATQSRYPIFGNTLVLQDGMNGFKPIFGMSGIYPVAYLRPPADAPGKYYWCKDGIFNEKNNKIYLFLFNCTPGSDGFSVTFYGTYMAVIDYQKLLNDPLNAIDNIVNINKGTDIIFGSSIYREGDLLYIYGSTVTPYDKQMHVAKVNMGDIANPDAWLHYKGGTNWQAGVANSISIFNNNSIEFTAFKSRDSWYLFNQDPTMLSQNIYRYKSSSPTGPWDNKKLIYTTPLSAQGAWTYDAKAHPEIVNSTDPSKLLISYDENIMPIDKAYANVDIYRSKFIWIKNWK